MFDPEPCVLHFQVISRCVKNNMRTPNSLLNTNRALIYLRCVHLVAGISTGTAPENSLASH